MKIKKIFKSILSFILIFVILIGSINVTSIKSHADALATFPVGQALWETWEELLEIGRYLNGYAQEVTSDEALVRAAYDFFVENNIFLSDTDKSVIDMLLLQASVNHETNASQEEMMNAIKEAGKAGMTIEEFIEYAQSGAFDSVDKSNRGNIAIPTKGLLAGQKKYYDDLLSNNISKITIPEGYRQCWYADALSYYQFTLYQTLGGVEYYKVYVPGGSIKVKSVTGYGYNVFYPVFAGSYDVFGTLNFENAQNIYTRGFSMNVTLDTKSGTCTIPVLLYNSDRALQYDYQICGVRLTRDGFTIDKNAQSFSTYGYKYTTSGSLANYAGDVTPYAPDLIEGWSGLSFNSLADANAFFNGLYVNEFNESLIKDSKTVIKAQDIVDAKAIEKILEGHDYVTIDELNKILDTNNITNYSTVNDYITDARTYITNDYHTIVNEGDTNTTVNEGDTIINNNYTSTYDDTAIRNDISGIASDIDDIKNTQANTLSKWDFAGWFSKLWEFLQSIIKGITDTFNEIRSWSLKDWLDWFKTLFDDFVISMKEYIKIVKEKLMDLSASVALTYAIIKTWDFKDWFTALTTLVAEGSLILTSLFEKTKEWTFADWWKDLFDRLDKWLFADWFKNLFGILEGWTFADWWEKLSVWVRDIAIGKPIEWLKELIKSIALTLEKTLEAVISIPKAITDFFTINPTEIQAAVTVPEHNIDFITIQNISSNFSNEYGNVVYPVIKITTPEILRRVYSSPEIILCDFGEYADICSKVRLAIKFSLNFGMVLWILKKFRLFFTT